MLPARAGVSRSRTETASTYGSAPRASGGVPSTSLAVPALLRAPGGVLPARVGVSRRGSWAMAWTGRTPCASGGVPVRAAVGSGCRPRSLREQGCTGGQGRASTHRISRRMALPCRRRQSLIVTFVAPKILRQPLSPGPPHVPPWGESGVYRQPWGARGENRPRNTARPRKTLKDLYSQVRQGHSLIAAGQYHQVDDFMTKSSRPTRANGMIPAPQPCQHSRQAPRSLRRVPVRSSLSSAPTHPPDLTYRRHRAHPTVGAIEQAQQVLVTLARNSALLEPDRVEAALLLLVLDPSPTEGARQTLAAIAHDRRLSADTRSWATEAPSALTRKNRHAAPRRTARHG